MGLEKYEGGNWISILNGKFCQRVGQETAGAIQRTPSATNKLTKVVYEKYYDSFVGTLVGIRTKDSPYGLNWVFDFQDKKEIYHLTTSYSNSYAKALLSMLPNADLSKPMRVSPMVKEVEGKKKSSLFLNQDGKPLKHYFTREHPNGLPPMVEVTVKGQKTWDDTAQLAFYENYVKTEIIPKLPKPTVVTPEPEQSQADKDFADLTGGEPKIDIGDF